jgi:hypothetical protein
MSDPARKLEQISDIGDVVGEKLGIAIRFILKHALTILIISTIGVLVFISSIGYSAWKKKS